jgi:hypothetical protein
LATSTTTELDLGSVALLTSPPLTNMLNASNQTYDGWARIKVMSATTAWAIGSITFNTGVGAASTIDISSPGALTVNWGSAFKQYITQSSTTNSNTLNDFEVETAVPAVTN